MDNAKAIRLYIVGYNHMLVLILLIIFFIFSQPFTIKPRNDLCMECICFRCMSVNIILYRIHINIKSSKNISSYKKDGLAIHVLAYIVFYFGNSLKNAFCSTSLLRNSLMSTSCTSHFLIEAKAAATPPAWPMAIAIGVTRTAASATCVALKHRPTMTKFFTLLVIILRYGIEYQLPFFKKRWLVSLLPSGEWMSIGYPPKIGRASCRGTVYI